VGLAGTLNYILRHPLNRDGRASALGRFVRWQIATRLSRQPVEFPFVDRVRFLAERNMTGASGNFYCGLHEPDEMAFVLHFLRPGEVFYDVGANIGSYSLLAAAAGASVHAFEPAPATAASLRRNVAANDLQAQVRVHECALGASAGRVQLTHGDDDTTNHVLGANETATRLDEVRMETFDACFEHDRPGFAKIDVEGYESQVLEGAVGALASGKLLGVVIEHGLGRRYGTRNSVERLVNAGFACHRYDAQTRQLEPSVPGRRGGNLIFLRDADAARERVQAARRFQLVNGWI